MYQDLFHFAAHRFVLYTAKKQLVNFPDCLFCPFRRIRVYYKSNYTNVVRLHIFWLPIFNPNQKQT